MPSDPRIPDLIAELVAGLKLFRGRLQPYTSGTDEAIKAAEAAIARAEPILLELQRAQFAALPMGGVSLDREGIARIIDPWAYGEHYEFGRNPAALEIDRDIARRKALAKADAILSALPEAGPAEVGWRPTHRHVKRGTNYQLMGRGRVQAEHLLQEYDPVTIYRGEDGSLWVRHDDEFNDGPFVALPAPPAPTGEAGEG